MPINNLTRGTSLANSVEIAKTPLKRMQGLLGRDTINLKESLVITQCNSIHMLFMKFAIDVVFLDKENKVAGVVAGIKPFEFSPIFWKSTCAIELPAGTIKESKTQVGDQTEIK